MSNETLALPSLRGVFGDWTYYVAIMKLDDVQERIRRADEVHSHTGLKEMLQRAITNRSSDIADYLCRQKQRFFNAIIAGIYDGEPKWFDVGIEGNNFVTEEEIEQDVKGSIGVLKLSGREKIFAIDGQHRLEGIKEACQRGCKVLDDEQTVIFLAHKNTKPGMKRTRRLFATLNRYAKPVSLSEIIALDEDDAVAITTRELLERNHYLKPPGVILVKKTKSVPKSNRHSFTSIQALYEFLDLILLLELKGKKKKDYKALRPADKELEEMYGRATKIINAMFGNIVALENYLLAKNNGHDEAPRSSNGGHLLFRPAGLLSFGRALQFVCSNGVEPEDAIDTLSSLEFDLQKPPWPGVLWEAGLGRMINRKANRDLAAKLMLYLCNYDLSDFGISLEKLKESYASAINENLEDLNFPRKVL